MMQVRETLLVEMKEVGYVHIEMLTHLGSISKISNFFYSPNQDPCSSVILKVLSPSSPPSSSWGSAKEDRGTMCPTLPCQSVFKVLLKNEFSSSAHQNNFNQIFGRSAGGVDRL